MIRSVNMVNRHRRSSALILGSLFLCGCHGLVSSAAIAEGDPRSPMFSWSLSRDIIERGETTDGKKTGEWFYFYASGEPLARGRYVLGAKDGLWEYWHESGHLWMAGEYVVSIEQGQSYSKPDGLWMVLTDEESLDRSAHVSLRCENSAIYTVRYWAERIDWSTYSEQGAQVLGEILPQGLSFKGAGYYKKGIRWRILTTEAFLKAASRTK